MTQPLRSDPVRSPLRLGYAMYRRSLTLVPILLAAACSNAPTNEASTSDEAPVPVAQRPVEAATTVNRAGPVTGATDPLKDRNSIPSDRSVFFDYDQSVIKGPDRPLLQGHADYLRQHPNAKIVVQGNTDERGTREYNIALGQERAETVMRLLRLLGAGDRQIDTVSFGKEKPRCTSNDESCWSQNRRVDLAYPRD